MNKHFRLHFSYIRWGYKIRVRPNKLWAIADTNSEYNSGNLIEPWRYQPNTFSGGELLFKGTFPSGSLIRSDYNVIPGARLSFNHAAIANNKAGLKYFEIKTVDSGWSTFCQFLLQY